MPRADARHAEGTASDTRLPPVNAGFVGADANKRAGSCRLPAPAVIVLADDRFAVTSYPGCPVVVVAAILARLVAGPLVADRVAARWRGGAATGAVVGGGGGGAGAFDLVGAAVLGGFGFAFVVTAAGVGGDVEEATDVGGDVEEATVDARAEALAIGEVLPVGVVFPQPVTIPMTSTMKPMTAMPNLCSFFIDGPPDGPPLSA